MNKEYLKSQCIIGAPLTFHDKLFIYPPLIKQILAAKHFDIYRTYFTMTQASVTDQITDFGKRQVEEKIPTPFELLLLIAASNPTVAQQLEDGLFFFTHQRGRIFPEQKMILFGEVTKAKSIDELVIIDENNYSEFQNYIRLALGAATESEPVEEENLDPRIQRMKAKARYRDYIKNKTGSTIELNEILVAVCCMNVGLNPLNIGEITYAALIALFHSSQKKEAYGWQMRLAISGNAAKKITPQYWIEETDIKKINK